MIVVNDLSMRFGDQWVLQNISFEVLEGEIVAVMGSSGGGKTTLVKCMSGLLNPTEGTVTLDGHPVHQREQPGEIGLVFQYAALFDSLSVKDNILFGVRRQRKLDRQMENETVSYLLELVQLDNSVASKMPSELSGGMRKRVGLARALAMKPKVLFYDEPTSGLDPATTFSIDELIVNTRDTIGVTSVVVSHDWTSVQRTSDKILFLDKGVIAYWGETSGFENSEHPAVLDLIRKSTVLNFS